MKNTPPVAADGATAVVTTTTRQVIPSNSEKDRKTPEFWPYIESLSADEWDRHILYLYRQGEDGRGIPLEKLAGTFSCPDGSTVSCSNQEEFELAIAKKYGGRIFRLILKRGSERVTETRVYIDAPVKNIMPPILENGGAGSGPMVTPAGTSDTAMIATRAIDTIAGQESAAVNIGISALRAASDVLLQQNRAKADNGGFAGDDLTRQALQIALQRALNPPDPLEQLTKLLALMNSLNPQRATGGADPAVAKILDTALERLLNPVASSGTAASSAGAELVRQLPGIAGYVAQSMHEWRAGMEAQRDTVALARGGAPPARTANGGPPAPTVLPPNNPAGDSAPGAEASAMTPNQPSLEWVEKKIVEIILEGTTAEEAADETLAFLDRLDGGLIAKLNSLGEPGLMGLFSTRPALRPATTNIPRLQEFIKAFVKLSGEHLAGPDAGAPGKTVH